MRISTPRRRPAHKRTTRSKSVHRHRLAGRRSVSRRRGPNFRWWQVATAVLVAVALITGAFALTAGRQPVAPSTSDSTHASTSAVTGAAATLLYAAPTATQASVLLPMPVRTLLVNFGMNAQAINLVRVEPDGATSARNVDLTPRLDGRTDGPILKVEARAKEAISATLTGLEGEMNTPSSDSSGRAMYSGLLKSSFPQNKPVIIVSSVLDLAQPLDARDLGFGVTPSRVAEALVESGYVPAMTGAQVIFVVVPTSGDQPQLRAPETAYMKDLWNTVLTKGGGASSVEFIDAPDGGASRADGPTPVVDLPELPGTPIKPTADPTEPKKTVCVVPSTTYFAYGTAELADEAKAAKALKPCIDKALAAGAELAVDAWTSYEGPLDKDGRPAQNPKRDVALAQARAQRVTKLLIEHLRVPRDRITATTGHGSADQPFPDNPRSSRNRVVTISYYSN